MLSLRFVGRERRLWMRDRLPLIYSGEQLVAVGDLWLADEAAASPGTAVRWIGRPALH